MNHMNIFNPYRDKSIYHEDELTRGFLLIVKNSPMVATMFFEMVRQRMLEEGIDSIPSMALGDLSLDTVQTQITNTHELFRSSDIEGNMLISIVISDDRLEYDAHITNDNRNARYDGVLICSQSYIFILENKPAKENIWLQQLNPNVESDKQIEIISVPCRLSWREVISSLQSLLQNQLVSGLEYTLIDDFMEYIEAAYPQLQPFTSFAMCKNTKYLLLKRIKSALSSLLLNGNPVALKYHRGWCDFFESGLPSIKKIALALNYDDESPSQWKLELPLYAGDSMWSARATYESLNTEKLFALEDKGFDIVPNFHFSFMSSNLVWINSALSAKDYIGFWAKHYTELKQIPRASLDEYLELLIKNRIIQDKDMPEIEEKILRKQYTKINICPGFKVSYIWSASDAISRDENNKFESDLSEKLKKAFEPFGGINISN